MNVIGDSTMDVRVGTCDFVDRASFSGETDDPRNHTN